MDKAQLCDWNNREEMILCRCCHTIPDEIYFIQDPNINYVSGVYLCKKCVDARQEDFVACYSGDNKDDGDYK